eukprot:2921066-Rhodomonas_salina.1
MGQVWYWDQLCFYAFARRCQVLTWVMLVPGKRATHTVCWYSWWPPTMRPDQVRPPISLRARAASSGTHISSAVYRPRRALRPVRY